MTPVIHCSAGNIHFFPRTTFIQQKETRLTKRNVSGSYSRLISFSPSQRFLLPQSSLCLFQIYRSVCPSKHGSRNRIIAAIGTDVTVEELNPAVSGGTDVTVEELNPAISGEDADNSSELPSNSVEPSESQTGNSAITSTATSKRSRPGRKSEMPPVKDEELTPGATFTGKVRSIQPFGAFVDFGAFTDGLVHVSMMSGGYVKDVGDVVSIGQEVKVRIVEANTETGRISLTMRDSDDASKRRESPARKNASGSSQKRGEGIKSSKFVKGQKLDGTVKNLTRSGAFVSLPDGEEGFIPASEESEGFGNIIGNSSLQVGQEVNVRVLRITRGRVTLTMKKEEDIEGLNRQLNQGVIHAATNPFELAFRKNKDISDFLVEREKAQTSEQTLDNVNGTTYKSDTLTVDGPTTTKELLDEPVVADEEGPLLESTSSEVVIGDEKPATESPQSSNGVYETSLEALISEGNDSSANFSDEDSIDKVPVTDDVTSVVLEDEEIFKNLSTIENENPLESVEASEEPDSIQEDGKENEISCADTKEIKLEAPEASNGETGVQDQPSVVKEKLGMAKEGTISNDQVNKGNHVRGVSHESLSSIASTEGSVGKPEKKERGRARFRSLTKAPSNVYSFLTLRSRRYSQDSCSNLVTAGKATQDQDAQHL